MTSLFLLALMVGLFPPAAYAQPVEQIWDYPPGPEATLRAVQDDGNGLQLTDAAKKSRLFPGKLMGLLESPLLSAESLVNGVTVTYRGKTPAGTSIIVDVRGQDGNGRWSEWLPAESGQSLQFDAVTTLQYRVFLTTENSATTPTLTALRLTGRSMLATPRAVPQSSVPLTARVFATREGLVGETTANGHVITPDDRFVALPSRRALNLNVGSNDYQVKIRNPENGREVIAPVWDIGPWNINDDYWNDAREREMWNDLPRGIPEAQAAYLQGYNRSRDGFGRVVLNPAGIDLADGTFWDDLDMTDNGWVEVTYLWTQVETATGRFTIGSPWDGAYNERITAYFDHNNPDYGKDGYFVRHDGSRKRNDCNTATYCYDGHSGTDYSMVENSPIYAVADGTVFDTVVGWNSGFGYTIVIDHGNGYRSQYSHLNSFRVAKGATVKRGDLIAFSGNTGSSTGPHLHFEVQKRVGTSYKRFDPFGWTGSFTEPCLQNGSCAASEFLWGEAATGSLIDVGQDSSRQGLFQDAFTRNGGQGLMGTPTNRTHWWDGVVIQDFRGGTGSDAAIIHDEFADISPYTVPAFALYGEIWQKYVALGGPSVLGPPTTDEFANAAGERQNSFATGRITWRDGSAAVFTPWPDSFTNWKAEYFNGDYANKPITGKPAYVGDEGTASGINYVWGEDAPGFGKTGVWADHFAARFSRKIFLDAGVYTFHTVSDDGVRLVVDGQTLIDDFHSNAYAIHNAEFVAQQSSEYEVVLEYLEIGGGARLELSWSRTGDVLLADYTYIEQSPRSTDPALIRTLAPGQCGPATLTLRNTGTLPWVQIPPGFTADQVNPDEVVLDLGTSGLDISERNRLSRFVDSETWFGLGMDRIKMQEDRVEPGEVGTFAFRFCVPEDMPSGEYREYFTPLAEYQYWLKDIGIHWLIIVNRPPEPPRLGTPPGTVFLGTEPVLLQWEAQSDPDYTVTRVESSMVQSELSPVSYVVEIATDAEFQQIVAKSSGMTEPEWEVREALPSGTYYWRVAANDGLADGAWSDTYSFEVRGSDQSLTSIYLPLVIR
jgi:murein DD-endopeptidase MepM/ murein hydrolase activator NlpD